MPYIDGRSGDIIVRIVYDGLAESGKTTSVHSLCRTLSLKRRGAIESPGSAGRRTEFFDWLDFTGGFIDGRRVRCQVVSVPGQAELLHRRRYLLESADAVVYVADSRAGRIDEGRRGLEVTARTLSSLEPVVPVEFVVQANKQDASDALSAEVVGERMGLASEVRCIGSVATEGEGVVECFVMAMRLATAHVRRYVANVELGELPAAARSHTALHAEMSGLVEDVPQSAPSAGEEPVAPCPGSPEPTCEAEPGPGQACESPGPVTEPRPEPNCPIPCATEVGAGHIWPPVKGRVSLALANAGRVQASPTVPPWCPAGAFEVRTDNGWVLHSSSEWVCSAESEARAALLTLVRHQARWQDLLPEGRTLIVAPERTHWRIWALTPSLPSLQAVLEDALARGDRARVTEVRCAAEELSERLRGMDGDGSGAVAAGAAGAAMQGGRAVALTLGVDSQRTRSLQGHLREIARACAARHPEARRLVESDFGASKSGDDEAA